MISLFLIQVLVIIKHQIFSVLSEMKVNAIRTISAFCVILGIFSIIIQVS
jgi:hypothetical protein